MLVGYFVKATADANGTLLITCPVLPEVSTFAATANQIVPCARAAIEEALGARISAGDSLPGPDSTRGHWVRLSLLAALKCELYMALQDERITRAQLARRLGWAREQTDRLFRLDHCSRLDQVEAAFQVLDRQIDFRVREVYVARPIQPFDAGVDLPFLPRSS